MVDVKALRELAEEWHSRAVRIESDAGGDDVDEIIALGYRRRSSELLALLAEPGDDALPEGWTAQRDETCVPSTIYDNANGHRVECFDDGDVLVDDESNTSYLRATELHAVLTHYLSRKGNDR